VDGERGSVSSARLCARLKFVSLSRLPYLTGCNVNGNPQLTAPVSSPMIDCPLISPYRNGPVAPIPRSAPSGSTRHRLSPGDWRDDGRRACRNPHRVWRPPQADLRQGAVRGWKRGERSPNAGGEVADHPDPSETSWTSIVSDEPPRGSRPTGVRRPRGSVENADPVIPSQ
jgi:hypothetical protein